MLGINDNTQDALLQVELDLARDFIAEKRNTFDLTDPLDPVPYVESRYESVQLQLASESFSKRGAEGEVSHGEAGVKRAYATGGLYSLATMNMVIPKVRVVSAVEDTE